MTSGGCKTADRHSLIQVAKIEKYGIILYIVV